MRYVTTYLLAVLLLQCFNVIAQSEPGYQILKEERKLGVSTASAYKVLDALVDQCEKDLKRKDFSPRRTLEIIGANIFRERFTFEDNHSTYAEALVSKKFDCDQFAITYLTISRRLKLPVYGVLIPEHMVVKWKDAKDNFLWETTINAEKDSSEYIRDFKISKESINNGVWLSDVSAKDESSIVDNYIGEYLVHSKKYDQSKEYFERVLTVMPHFSSSRNNLGVAFRRAGDLDRAKKQLSISVKEDPFDYFALNNLGLVFLDKKEYDSAIYYCDKSIAINNKYAVSQYNRGLILCQGLKKYDDAIKAFDEALSLGIIDKSELSECYMNKGVCYIYKKNYNEALVELSKAWKLNANNSNILVNMAISKYYLGQKSSACEDIREAIKMGNQTAGLYSKRICL